ncbi:unnamed protein product [Trichobilharzia regenti]|nr:unnamed protein product [Trichobilharzia regenti]
MTIIYVFMLKNQLNQVIQQLYVNFIDLLIYQDLLIMNTFNVI